MKIWLVIILLTVNVWGQEKEAKQPVSWQAVARGLQYEPKILEAAEKYRIDPRYVWVIGYLETKFKKEARSPVGAEGLMQFMPATAKRMGVQNTYDPHQSIEGAAKYLKFLYSKFGHPASMMAGYNAGEQAVDCYLKGYSVKLPNGKVINPNRIKTAFGVPPYQETMGYVKEGMRLLALMKLPGEAIEGSVVLEATVPVEVALNVQPKQKTSVIVGETAVPASPKSKTGKIFQ